MSTHGIFSRFIMLFHLLVAIFTIFAIPISYATNNCSTTTTIINTQQQQQQWSQKSLVWGIVQSIPTIILNIVIFYTFTTQGLHYILSKWIIGGAYINDCDRILPYRVYGRRITPTISPHLGWVAPASTRFLAQRQHPMNGNNNDDNEEECTTLYYDEQGKGHEITASSLSRRAADSATMSNIYSIPAEWQIERFQYFYDMIRMTGLIITTLMCLFYLGWLIFGTWMIATHPLSICSGNSSYNRLFITEIVLYWVSFGMLLVIGIIGICKYK